MSIAYVVQDDPSKNFLPALDHAKEIVTILERGSQVTFNAAPTVEKLLKALWLFSDKDFVVAVGDPVAIGIACAVAARQNGGRVQLLKWDRQERKYYQVRFDVEVSPYRK